MDNEVIIAADTMVDLVVVYCPLANQTMLVKAPAWSGLKRDDAVVLSNETPATVLSSITICKEEPAYSFILSMGNYSTPMARVKSRVNYEYFHYLDEEEGANDG